MTDETAAALRPYGAYQDGRLLRAGYTTGTCAAAAAQAALVTILTGKTPEAVAVRTPAGPELLIEIEEDAGGSPGISACGGAPAASDSPADDGASADAGASAVCGVRKDAGDDPDVTDGLLILCEVRFVSGGEAEVEICGGEGIGRVTRPGLDQPVGEPAINRVPRQMIREALLAVMEEQGACGRVTVTVSAPEGAKAAEKTFNPRLGITGGISILGTEGIVRPMSRAALIDTIRAELKVRVAEGGTVLAVPGSYGLGFLRERYGLPEADPVIMSNFVGETVDAAAELEAPGLVLAGHLGKFVKLSGGIMNTHSREADCRMELLAAHALLCGADRETAVKLLRCGVTEEAADLLEDAGLLKAVSGSLLKAAEDHLERRCGGRIPIGVILYTLKHGVLAESRNVGELLREARGRRTEA